MKKAEKALLNNDKVNAFWQKKAWVDAAVMEKIAVKFVEEKNAKHGEKTWVLLFCDNLSAHLADEVRKIFGDNKVFLCFWTEIIGL